MTNQLKKHWGKTLIGLAVTVVALWWSLRGEDLGEIWRQMRHGNPWLLAAAVAVATFGFLVRAMRWKILLAPVRKNTRLGPRFAAVSIGFMATNVLPLRAGEFARPYAFSKMEPVSMSAAFGSLVVERFLDSVALTLLLVLPVLTPGFPRVGALSTGFGAVALRGGLTVVGIVLAALVAMALWPRTFVRATETIAGKVLPTSLARPLVNALDAFLDSISLLRSPRLLALSFLWTLGFWLLNGVSFWIGMLAFDIHTGLVSGWFTQAVVGFAVAMPSAPGFVGTFHAGARFALSDVYSVDPTKSLAFAFGYWAGGWFPITAIGLWYAWRLGMSLGEVSAAEGRVEASVEEVHPESVAHPSPNEAGS